MALPIGGADVDFDVAGDAAHFGADEKGGAEKVGAGAGVPVAGAFDADDFAGEGGERGGAEAVVGPDALEMAFGERQAVGWRAFGDAAGARPGQKVRIRGAGEPIGGDVGWNGRWHAKPRWDHAIAEGRGEVNAETSLAGPIGGGGGKKRGTGRRGKRRGSARGRRWKRRGGRDREGGTG